MSGGKGGLVGRLACVGAYCLNPPPPPPPPPPLPLLAPLPPLHRDADIEIQTDGFDETSYGVIDSVHDPSMGWGGGGLFLRLFT